MKGTFKSRIAGASLLALAVSSSPAIAQEAQDEGDSREIVVTAQFREQNLQDTPLAITAVNAAMLEARGQSDITQVAAQAPNVTLRPQPQNGGSGLIAFIRGVGQTDFNYALDPGVGVYIDDVYIPTLSSSLLELIDLDRIEILRGPQGTLAGKNSIGGAIKLFSAKPRGDNSGSLEIGYGSYNALSVKGMADFAISENLAARVSGMTRSSDGYVTALDYGVTHPNSNVPANNARGRGNPDYLKMGGQDITAIRGALRFTPTSSLEINISGDYTRENSDPIPAVLIAAGAVAPAGTVFDPTSVADSSSFTGAGVNPWLVGKDGTPVNMSCAFVPAGPYSCDTGGDLGGRDPRYVSYSNFLDSAAPTVQAPFKPYNALPITKFTGWGVHGTLSYDLSDSLNLYYIGSYRSYNSKFGQDQDATPIPVAQLDNELDHYAWSQEVRLNFDAADGMLEGTVGAFYLKQKGTYTARVDLNYVSPVIDFIHGPDTTPSNTKAVFATATVRPVEGLSLTGGVRYTKDKKDYTYFRSNPDGTLPNGFNCFVANGVFSEPNCLLAGIFDVTGTFKGDRWDYRLAADYRFSPEFLAYASFSTGFKGGGVNPRPFVSDQALPFNPETLKTYEVGFKADLLDRRVRLNAAAFLNKYADITLGKLVCPESSLPTPCLRPANIGSADVKGFELEASVRPIDGFTLDGSLAVLDFEYTSPAAGGLLAGTAIPENAITPYTPETTWSFGAQYDHEVDIGTFSLRFDGSYQSKMYTSSENTFWSRMSGRFLANGQLSYASSDDDWKVTFEVKNIFDKYYFLSVADVSTSLGVVTGVPGMPRTFAVRVKKNF
ncbi:MAG: TonB-dependent receptor [Sphingomonadaceae bacterium]